MTTTVAAVVVLAILAAAAVMVLALDRDRTAPSDGGPAHDDWLDRARVVADDGFHLIDRIEMASGPELLSQLPDGAIDALTSRTADYGSRVAALSASAPTVMDTRVCREVGVQVRTLGEVLEDERRARAQPDDDGRTRAGRDAAGPAVEDLRVAVRDLRDHLELL